MLLLIQTFSKSPNFATVIKAIIQLLCCDVLWNQLSHFTASENLMKCYARNRISRKLNVFKKNVKHWKNSVIKTDVSKPGTSCESWLNNDMPKDRNFIQSSAALLSNSYNRWLVIVRLQVWATTGPSLTGH